MSKRVDFEVGLFNDQKAVAGFNNIEQSFNRTGRSLTNFSRRDMAIFANQVLYNVDITGRLGTALSNVATGLAMGGLIGAGFAAGAALLALLTDNSKELTQALTEQEKRIKSLKDEWKKYREEKEKYIGVLSVENYLDLMQQRIGLKGRISTLEQDLQLGVAPGVGKLNEVQRFERATKLGLLREDLKEINDQIDFLNFGWRKWGEELDKSQSQLKGIKDTVSKITGGEGGIKQAHAFDFNAITGGRGIDFAGGRQRAEMTLEEKDYISMLRRRAELEKDFAEDTASIFRDEMTGAFESVWGEANSLGEKVIEHWLSMIASKSAAKGITSLLRFIPGVGNILDWLEL